MCTPRLSTWCTIGNVHSTHDTIIRTDLRNNTGVVIAILGRGRSGRNERIDLKVNSK